MIIYSLGSLRRQANHSLNEFKLYARSCSNKLFRQKRYANKWHLVTEYNLLNYVAFSALNKITITGPTTKIWTPMGTHTKYSYAGDTTTHLTANKILK
jgi:hypothetical protein